MTSSLDNLSVGQRPAYVAKEPTIFDTRAEVEALVLREKEKTSSTTACLNLRPPYLALIATTPYPVGYIVPNF